MGSAATFSAAAACSRPDRPPYHLGGVSHQAVAEAIGNGHWNFSCRDCVPLLHSIGRRGKSMVRVPVWAAFLFDSISGGLHHGRKSRPRRSAQVWTLYTLASPTFDGFGG